MQLYGVVMEGKKLDRLDLDWEILGFLLREIEIWIGGLRFLEGGGKVLFLRKKLKISKNFRKKYAIGLFCFIFIFIIRATFSHAMKN